MTKYYHTLFVDCTAPKDLFVADYPIGVSKETQKIVEEQQGIPCEGGGVVYPQCYECPWCASLEWLDFEEA